MENIFLALVVVLDIILCVIVCCIYRDVKEHSDRLNSFIGLSGEKWHNFEKLRESQNPRQLFVFDPIYKKWVLTDFENINDGDLFKIIQNGVRYVDQDSGDSIWVAKGKAYIGLHGDWEIKTYY